MGECWALGCVPGARQHRVRIRCAPHRARRCGRLEVCPPSPGGHPSEGHAPGDRTTHRPCDQAWCTYLARNGAQQEAPPGDVSCRRRTGLIRARAGTHQRSVNQPSNRGISRPWACRRCRRSFTRASTSCDGLRACLAWRIWARAMVHGPHPSTPWIVSVPAGRRPIGWFDEYMGPLSWVACALKAPCRSRSPRRQSGRHTDVTRGRQFGVIARLFGLPWTHDDDYADTKRCTACRAGRHAAESGRVRQSHQPGRCRAR